MRLISGPDTSPTPAPDSEQAAKGHIVRAVEVYSHQQPESDHNRDNSRAAIRDQRQGYAHDRKQANDHSDVDSHVKHQSRDEARGRQPPERTSGGAGNVHPLHDCNRPGGQQDERAGVRAGIRRVARADAAGLPDVGERGDRQRAAVDDGGAGVGVEAGQRLDAAAGLDDGQLARAVGENGREHARTRTAELDGLAAGGEVGNRARAVGERRDEGRDRDGAGIRRSRDASGAKLEGGARTQGVDGGRGGSAEQAGRRPGEDDLLRLADAAKRLGVGRVVLSRLLNGTTGISPEMALRLSKALGTAPEFWYGMQVNYDLWQAKKKFRGKVKPIVHRERAEG